MFPVSKDAWAEGELVIHPSRVQPYTVWLQGEVIYFAFTEAEAKAHLEHARSVIPYRRQWR